MPQSQTRADVRQAAADLLQAFRDRQGSPWYEAVVYAALDQSHNLEDALKIAEQVMERYPSGYFARRFDRDESPDRYDDPLWHEPQSVMPPPVAQEPLSPEHRHQLAFELSPGEGSPWLVKHGGRYNALPVEAQRAVTRVMTDHAADLIQPHLGHLLQGLIHASGGWQNFPPNPNAVAFLHSNPEVAMAVAHALRHMLQQSEVWSNHIRSHLEPNSLAVDFWEPDSKFLEDDNAIQDFWHKLRSIDPFGAFEGYQALRTSRGHSGIRVLLDSDAVKGMSDNFTGDLPVNSIQSFLLGPAFKKLTASLPYHLDAAVWPAHIYKAINDWRVHNNGEVHLSRLQSLAPGTGLAGVVHHGPELEARFIDALDRAERDPGFKPGGASAIQQGGGGQGTAQVAPVPATAPQRSVSNLPGETCPVQYRSIIGQCDHCQTNRRRNETFVVRSSNGEHKVVGRQCLKDFLGYHDDPHQAGKRIQVIKVTCEKVIAKDGQYGTTGIHKLVDEVGNDLTWFASESSTWLKEGETVTVSLTVKSHGEYNGRKQTVVTRLSVWTEEALADYLAKEAKKAARLAKKVKVA